MLFLIDYLRCVGYGLCCPWLYQYISGLPCQWQPTVAVTRSSKPGVTIEQPPIAFFVLKDTILI